MDFLGKMKQSNLLSGKKILIGATGSIAIYKALELVRLFVKANAEVKVVMSEDAKKFITPMTFEVISQNKVLHAQTESWSEELSHVHLSKWADVFVIAPATVNTINKLTAGIADNLITQTAIAFPKTIIIAPSANTRMMLNPITWQSTTKLESLGYEIVTPQSKLLACNDEGVGALADVEQIFFQTARNLLKNTFWEDRDVIITGGGSIEKIDDVRCISNFSSGKQSAALALAFYLKGASVTLITSGEKAKASGIRMVDVQSSEQFRASLVNEMDEALDAEKTPFVIMAAAISDFVPTSTHSGKLKKEIIGESWNLELKKNTDILATISKEGFKVVGFKAELDNDNALNNATSMLKAKHLDAVCLNVIKDGNSFGSTYNEVSFITPVTVENFLLDDKFSVAQKIVEQCEAL